MACRVHLVLEPPAKRLRKGDNFVDKIYWDVRPSRFTRVQDSDLFMIRWHTVPMMDAAAAHTKGGV